MDGALDPRAPSPGRKGGRWGDLEPPYPRWRDFLRVREEPDPHGGFLNPYPEELLGVRPPNG
ncbi:MAG: hypothetical protein KM310_11425 [Clostridiales bacterium]|nr:hypothetical protein [Clostridiales bacterium]